jgi:peptidoglycan/LPS O-acetylase OafA/YrhL
VITTRLSHHANAFGLLRLFFASLVIVSHTPELYYGNRDKEILTRIFGTLSFGEVAVDAFFVISGYLIAGSFVESKSPLNYLRKRVARIYPGFLAAYLFCLIVAIPLGGANLPQYPIEYFSIAVRALMLQQPNMGEVFKGSPYPILDGAMWTIAYEFRCYLLILILGLTKTLDRPYFVIIATMFLIALSAYLPVPYHAYTPNPAGPLTPAIHSLGEWRNILTGDTRQTIRLAGAFLVGTCFYLFRSALSFNRMNTLMSAIGLVAGLFFKETANAAVTIFGGYIIFLVAMTYKNTILANINNENDVSYGVYLYAWPIEKILLTFEPGLPMWMSGVLTLVFAYMMGWISWVTLERPVMAAVRLRSNVAHASMVSGN